MAMALHCWVQGCGFDPGRGGRFSGVRERVKEKWDEKGSEVAKCKKLMSLDLAAAEAQVVKINLESPTMAYFIINFGL